MRGSTKMAWVVVLAAVVLPLTGAAQDKPFAAEALVLSPPATAAPLGEWSYAAPNGYMWIPEAVPGTKEAEWSPWDPWWAMPYGRWAWAEGRGWGWTPMIPSWDMSPLGWGYDSWYGGWYGFTPDGNPSNTIGSYIGCYGGYGGGTLYDNQTPGKEYFIGPGWWRNHGYKGHDDEWPSGHYPRTEPSRVKVVSVVAKPPVTLNPILPMKDLRDRVEPGQGRMGYERPSGRRDYRKNRDDRTEPAKMGGGHHGNGQGGGGQVSKPPTGMGQSGGSYSSPKSSSGGGKPPY